MRLMWGPGDGQSMREAFRDLSLLRGLAAGLAVILTGTIAACGVVSTGPERIGDVFDKVRSLDLQPRAPQSSAPATSTGGQEVRAESYFGTGVSAQVIAPAQRTPNGGEGYELNFENTPVTTVAKVVLGDIMGLGYTI